MSGIKIICDNRKAFHDYSFEEKWEAGIVLAGTEVKSLREGKASLRDGYAILKNGELFLLNAHMTPYSHAGHTNHDPLRTRKLLLHKAELQKLWSKLSIRGYTLIPLKLYFKEGIVKVELGLGKGKKSHDKRATEKERDAKRNLNRVKRRNR